MQLFFDNGLQAFQIRLKSLLIAVLHEKVD
jgi:hypothetical protein